MRPDDKVDGDGQMGTNYLESLLLPHTNYDSLYTKGDMFSDFGAFRKMPRIRLFGNSALSFILKICSGYWDVMDPINGYTIVSRTALKGIILSKIDKRYFFESNLLIELGINGVKVIDVSIPAKYEDEESSLSVRKVLVDFPFKLIRKFFKRILFRYYLLDFNMGSIFIIFGLLFFCWGLIFSGYRWYYGVMNNVENITGTVMLAVLAVILGTQFLLQAINIDINNSPNNKK